MPETGTISRRGLTLGLAALASCGGEKPGGEKPSGEPSGEKATGGKLFGKHGLTIAP